MEHPAVHDLKIWPGHFEAILLGRKTFEVRRDDRDFQVGDLLLLREWLPGTDIRENPAAGYTGRSITRRISHLDVLDGIGVRGFVAMGVV